MKNPLLFLVALAFSAAPALSANDFEGSTLRIADEPAERDLDERQVVPHLRLGPTFTDADVFDLAIFEEPLVPLSNARETAEERTAFIAAVSAFQASVEAMRGGFGNPRGIPCQFSREPLAAGPGDESRTVAI